ncbi:MAG: hypothetical protein IPK85_20035 [Gemmatimonadetes bacterium]|nr:hypothetical protein [Gemmatimonadota bacterium]
MSDPLNSRPANPPAEARASTVKDGDLATPMELRDFLEQVGTTMRLPSRTTVSMTAVREAPAPRARSRPVFLPLLALVSLGAWAVLELQPPPVATVPTTLHGTWVTDDPRYAGRTLELQLERVTVRYPGGNETTTVRSVDVQSRGDTLAVILRHGDAVAPQELSFALVPTPEAHLVLRNPEAVRWYRVAVGGA